MSWFIASTSLPSPFELGPVIAPGVLALLAACLPGWLALRHVLRRIAQARRHVRVRGSVIALRPAGRM